MDDKGFKMVVGVIMTLVIAYIISVAYIGSKAYSEYKERNSSVGIMIGKFIKDVNMVM
jgi:hypothetical protein